MLELSPRFPAHSSNQHFQYFSKYACIIDTISIGYRILIYHNTYNILRKFKKCMNSLYHKQKKSYESIPVQYMRYIKMCAMLRSLTVCPLRQVAPRDFLLKWHYSINTHKLTSLQYHKNAILFKCAMCFWSVESGEKMSDYLSWIKTFIWHYLQ